MTSWIRSKWLGALLGTALLLLIMTTAVLAGSGSLSPWLNIPRGWESSTFWDGNLTATDTTVSFAHSCDDEYPGTSDSQEWAKLGLWRYAGFFPWEDRGQIQHTCGNASFVTWNWGVQSSPDEWFKWSVQAFSGSNNHLDVDSPGVNWHW